MVVEVGKVGGERSCKASKSAVNTKNGTQMSGLPFRSKTDWMGLMISNRSLLD